MKINYAATCGFNLDLIRLMFAGLRDQTCQDFELVLSDHYFNKHQDAVKELADSVKFPVTHVPVIPHPTIPRHYIDCSVFNQSPLFGEAERFVRLSEWRLVHPTLTESIVDEPDGVLVDFHFQEAPECAWDAERDLILWDEVEFLEYSPEFHEKTPLNCFGNNSLDMKTWGEVNGFNEVAFNFYHFEDYDYSVRLANAGIPCRRVGDKMFRIKHSYGPHPGRCENPPERPFVKPCGKCERLIQTIRAVVGVVKFKQWSDFFLCRGDDPSYGVRVVSDDFQEYIICNFCGFRFPKFDSEEGWGRHSDSPGYTRSAINLEGAGRNVAALWDKMRGRSLGEKLEIYENSWTNPYFLK